MHETLLTKVHQMDANCGAIALERSGLTPRRTAEHTHHDTSMDSNSSDLERFKGTQGELLMVRMVQCDYAMASNMREHARRA